MKMMDKKSIESFHC